MESLERIIKDNALYVTRDVTDPFEYLDQLHGKQIRKLLVLEFGKNFDIPEKSLKVISDFIGELHTASLLIDDIEDSAELRRGKVTAHKQYGTWVTLNSAEFSIYRSISKLMEQEDHPRIPGIVNDELLRLHVGQGKDIYWRDNGIVPTIDEYYEMAKNKTGGLFRLMVRLISTLSKDSKGLDLIPLANALGILYQIRDDYLNLFSEEMFEQKGFADDLSEGKFSFPLIHAINYERRAAEGDNYVFETLSSKPADVDSKRKLLNYLKLAYYEI